jgi:hypothetical protein
MVTGPGNSRSRPWADGSTIADRHVRLDATRRPIGGL